MAFTCTMVAVAQSLTEIIGAGARLSGLNGGDKQTRPARA